MSDIDTRAEKPMSNLPMFCYQCEQTGRGTGCVQRSTCGKDPETAALQDLLIYAAKGISQFASRAAALGKRDAAVDRFVVQALFATVTNVDFDPQRMKMHLEEAVVIRDRAQAIYEAACREKNEEIAQLNGATQWRPEADLDGLVRQGRAVTITLRKESLGEDITGLQELVLYGLKGTCAYLDHAMALGHDDADVCKQIHDGLAFLCKSDPSVDELFNWAMQVGQINLRVMELLDAANTGTYGHPEPTQIRVTPVAGKAILVTGHDLKDLHLLLEKVEGTGINVYTHGEMLPCLAYPGLKKYSCLKGNYGGAWQDQKREFADFPGPVVFTTNCLMPPKDTYIDNLFTTGMVAYPGVKHIGEDKDFSPVIEKANELPGFAHDAPEQTITIGFGHNAVLGVADKVIEAVKAGQIRHFFLIGGCDGAESGRNYYTEFAEQTPQDTVMLTLACGKFRFNKGQYGDIGGIPRLLDIGQCNDAYSAIKIATALAGAFECGVNDLPLSMILSWFEQKAVAILLTLLSLGIKDIRLGPKLPAFITPTVLNVLVEKFNIQPITTVQQDMAAALAS